MAHNHASSRSKGNPLWLLLPAGLVAAALFGLSKADQAKQTGGSMHLQGGLTKEQCRQQVLQAMRAGSVPSAPVIDAWWNGQCCNYSTSETTQTAPRL